MDVETSRFLKSFCRPDRYRERISAASGKGFPYGYARLATVHVQLVPAGVPCIPRRDVRRCPRGGVGRRSFPPLCLPQYPRRRPVSRRSGRPDIRGDRPPRAPRGTAADRRRLRGPRGTLAKRAGTSAPPNRESCLCLPGSSSAESGGATTPGRCLCQTDGEFRSCHPSSGAPRSIHSRSGTRPPHPGRLK